MTAETALHGVIDIGSNAVRMVIYDTSHTPPVQIYNEKVFCPLGKDLAGTGLLNSDGKRLALEGLHEYAGVARAHKLQKLDVVGTASLRDAKDGDDFVRRIDGETGLQVRVISGHQEARYAALGVLSLDRQAQGIVGDFGGGSLEFARIKDQTIGETASRPYGAFRAVGMGDQAAQIIGDGLRELSSQYGDAAALHIVGGSWRSLAQAHLDEAGQTRETLQGYEIPRSEMLDFCQAIQKADIAVLMEKYKFEDKRAALAPISAFVLAQVLEGLRPQKIVVSLAGIRDGILYDFLHPSGLSNG